MAFDEDSLKKELLEKKKSKIADKSVDFSNKLKKELLVDEPVDVNYSTEYSFFKKEQISTVLSVYEKLCKFSSKIIKLDIGEKREKELNQYLVITHLDITASQSQSFALIAMIASFILSIGSFFITGSLLMTLLLFGGSLGVFMYLRNYPKKLYEIWRSKASDQFVLSVLYAIIYMKQDSNLERAVYFISKNIAPPLSLDFMKILWNFQSGAFATIEDAFEDYLKIWKGKEDSFIDAIHLVMSSLKESNRERANDLLEKSKDTILQSVNDKMLHYAHGLQQPIQTIYLLGIVLPILLLTLMPMVGAFMGDMVKTIYLFMFYNVFLAFIIWFMSKNILLNRPSGISSTDLGLILFEKNYKKKFYLLLAVLVFILLAAPFLLSVLGVSIIGSETLNDFLLSNTVVFYFSVLFVAAIGFSIAIYFYFSNKKPYFLKSKLNKIEESFSSVVYQVGVKMDQNIPAETAIVRLADENAGTEAGEFFSLVYSNMAQKGMSLKDALFDKSAGAINSYPSAMINSIMSLLIESVKKSPKIAAESLITVSAYLRDVKRVYERLKDLLADTLSSISMQSKFLAPIISGVVVGLSVLITRVLLQLSGQMDRISELTSGAGAAGSSVDLGTISFFTIESVMPSPVFQLIIGIYVIEIVFILSYLYSGVIFGFDKIEFKNILAKNLFLSTAIYTLISIIGSFLLSKVAGTIATGVV